MTEGRQTSSAVGRASPRSPRPFDSPVSSKTHTRSSPPESLLLQRQRSKSTLPSRISTSATSCLPRRPRPHRVRRRSNCPSQSVQDHEQAASVRAGMQSMVDQLPRACTVNKGSFLLRPTLNSPQQQPSDRRSTISLALVYRRQPALKRKQRRCYLGLLGMRAFDVHWRRSRFTLHLLPARQRRFSRSSSLWVQALR